MVRVDGLGEPGLIRIRSLDKKYRRGSEEIHVLQGLNLDVAKGEFVAFMGPSGSGKTLCSICLVVWTCPRPAASRWPVMKSRICPATALRSGAPSMSVLCFRCTT